MKRIILASLFFVFCHEVMADDSKTQLVVWQTDGSCVFYSLDEYPKTTFSNDNLVITTTNISVEYPMAKIARYTYDSSTNGIDKKRIHKGIIVKQTGNELIISNLPKGGKVSVFTVDGKLINSIQSAGQELIQLPLRQLTKGTYIIKTDDITYKILKR